MVGVFERRNYIVILGLKRWWLFDIILGYLCFNRCRCIKGMVGCN